MFVLELGEKSGQASQLDVTPSFHVEQRGLYVN